MKAVSAKDTDPGEVVDDVSTHKDCLLVSEEPKGASREYIEMAREHLGMAWLLFLDKKVRIPSSK